MSRSSSSNTSRTPHVRDELRAIQHEKRELRSSKTKTRTAKQQRSERQRSTWREKKENQLRHQSVTQMRSRRRGGGALQVFFAAIIVLLATVNFLTVFKTYATNMAQLNSLKNQEAQLIAQKADLENDIQRWSDKAYVTSQARKRLGFVFPGERSVIVKNAPSDAQSDAKEKVKDTSSSQLPWYTELMYSIESTDQAENSTGSKAQ
ncbi:septum formation initiator family protein [Alloscardovia venturai]|uniref:Septum formation initiator family protein n=2 Tax=Alloscardovia venturai TaxID=1769421 RepID=A0ABW2Y3L6_9BIFI